MSGGDADPRVVDAADVALSIMDRLAESKNLNAYDQNVVACTTHSLLENLFRRHGVRVISVAWAVWAGAARHGEPEHSWAALSHAPYVHHARTIVELARASQFGKVGRYLGTVLDDGGMPLVWMVSAALALAASDASPPQPA